MSLVVDEHREFLSDRTRLEVFERAIAATVHPGDIVIDLGAGTGILGLFACRAGAARVYAIENGGMIELARAIAHGNGVSDRITFLRAHSSEARLPEQADVLVGDLIGRMGFEAGVFEAYADVRPWLRPGPRTIPDSITISTSPVEQPAAHANVEFWREPMAGFRADAALAWSRNTGYPRDIQPCELLSDAPVSSCFSPLDAGPVLRVAGEASITRAGRLHGLACWFDARMSAADPSIVLTNAPGASARINRRNVFLPLHPPVDVRERDRIDIDLRIRPREFLVGWNVTARTADGVTRMKHSTLGGMLLTREDLKAQDPASRPRLTARGVARRTLLELCDGNRSIVDIEREMRRRHPDLFSSDAGAQAFVAEVVSGYGAFD
ncbi:MAG TPA: 50S ribosomal protein L11 methyltransferase [Vicinamibacterales bacterium]